MKFEHKSIASGLRLLLMGVLLSLALVDTQASETESTETGSRLLFLHPNHFSTAEVQWNENTGHFEVALCVYPADLEKALSILAGRSIDLDRSEKLDQLMQQYVAKRFFIRQIPKITELGITEPRTSSVQSNSSTQKSMHSDAGVHSGAAPTAANATVDDKPANLLPDSQATSSKASTPDKSATLEVPEQLVAVKQADLRWVGFEANLKEAWLYFEIKGQKEPATWEIENRVFFEFNEEQVNQIRWQNGGQNTSYSLRANQPVWRFETARQPAIKIMPNSLR